mmetsp:Transcript_56247/g.162984  ORF Transcript_56247/g.162984 Transcript_56247/m.162984 type:complete len:325 (+) Transcript_56247:115-1089(+)
MANTSWKVQSPSLSLVIFGLTVAYVGICGLTSLWLGTYALLLSVLLLLLQVAVAAEAFDLRHHSMPWLLMIWALTVAVAASVGVSNFHTSYEPYLAAKSGRFYNGVGADAKAAVLMDAGVITFDDAMVLDDSLAVGLSLAGSTYCVAPILSTGGPSPGASGAAPAGAVEAKAMVQFWAIGIDCCGSRSGFVCDDAGEASARSGLVWLDPADKFDTSPEQDHFAQAIEAACALHDLQTVPQPLLLHWVKEPKNVMLGLFTRSLLVWIVSSIAYGAVASIVCIIAHTYFNTAIRGSLGEITAGTRPEHMERFPGQGKGPPMAAAGV